MRVIHKKTGVDIINCDDIETLRGIILEQMADNLSLAEEYGFFVLKCYRQHLPIISVRDWLKIRDK